MQQYGAMLLDVWREACRHIEIEQASAVIADILRPYLPLDRLRVATFDWQKPEVAFRAPDGDASRSEPPRKLTTVELRRCQRWFRLSEIVLQEAGDQAHPALAALLGTDPDGYWLMGPLKGEHGAAGALLLRAAAAENFTMKHAEIVKLLLEPFSVALDNDQRLHELQTLRDAAEAEKRSAFSRLGRESLVDTIVGATGGLEAVMERVALVARSDLPVLIMGETGSGKEVIGRAIHQQSPRAKNAFIRVNCGAISPELIDSELFGHEKGAFTGAATLRRGWFERAEEGTLLLDEIGELPLAAQVRLLRVLQEGTFERVGGERSIRVNVRILAATHRDLPAMVQQGRFREDLWYRIAGFPIVLPPLRERKQDIPDLAAHFAERAARHFGLRLQLPTPADLALLVAYAWPGNTRELASVIDRAAILGDGQRLEIAAALGTAQPLPVQRIIGDESGTLPSLTLDEAMRRHIEGTLTATRGRIDGPRGAAALLKINPHTLRARMRKLGIDWTQFR